MATSPIGTAAAAAATAAAVVPAIAPVAGLVASLLAGLQSVTQALGQTRSFSVSTSLGFQTSYQFWGNNIPGEQNAVGLTGIYFSDPTNPGNCIYELAYIAWASVSNVNPKPQVSYYFNSIQPDDSSGIAYNAILKRFPELAPVYDFCLKQAMDHYGFSSQDIGRDESVNAVARWGSYQGYANILGNYVTDCLQYAIKYLGGLTMAPNAVSTNPPLPNMGTAQPNGLPQNVTLNFPQGFSTPNNGGSNPALVKGSNGVIYSGTQDTMGNFTWTPAPVQSSTTPGPSSTSNNSSKLGWAAVALLAAKLVHLI